MVKDIVIIDALRTPIGKYRGQLSKMTAVELGTAVTKALFEKNDQVKDHVEQVIFGNVLQAGNGQNPARQIALNSGLSAEIPASTINQVCGSGLKAISMARQQILLGEAEVIVAGGIESMTNAPSITYYNKEEDTLSKPVPTMTFDGLTDAFSGKIMGLTAENVAEQYGVSREAQDAFAYGSQMKAAKAQEQGIFAAEILPLEIGDEVITQDEGVRQETTLEKLSLLRTIFKEDGTVTAGNASTINDGASAVIIASKEFAETNQIPYLAIVHDITEIGIDPSIMGIAPVSAINKLIDCNQISMEEIDLFEINEAFAASSVVVQKELSIPDEKINIGGSGIALGHPLGATGARIVTTLAHQLKRTHGRYGIASLCIGGGLGLAILIEVPQEDQPVKKFYQLAREDRLARLQEQAVISPATKHVLAEMTLPEDIADNLIENQISEMEIPLGVALNLRVNDKSYTIPLATEEPSVIAACNNGAKMANHLGGFQSELKDGFLRGQIVLMNVKEPATIEHTITAEKAAIFRAAAQSYPSIVKRGGGLKEIVVRTFDDDPTFLSIDLIVDTKDAMGANIINTILEGVAGFLREILTEEIVFSILSNYATESIVTASCRIPYEALSKKGDGKRIAEKVAAASKFAQLDPYRAATHNKGIMNGIEAVVLASGNDTRAVAAAAHAYASRDQHYRGLSQWQVAEGALHGEISLPLALGSVGGAIEVLPKAKAAFEIMGITEAKELAEVTAAVGLAQNLAALRALVSEGIQQGHMSLQARSLALSVGATGKEVEILAEKLQGSRMNQANAQTILAEIRSQKVEL